MENNISKEEQLKIATKELDEIRELMKSKGFSLREIYNIFSTYKDFIDLQTDNDDRYIKHTNNIEEYTYSSEKVKCVRFETKNEVRLLHCLNNINPHFKADELGKMVGIIYHLLGVKTEWYTIPSPENK